MHPYDEHQVLAFAEDCAQAFREAGVLPPADAAKWIALMERDAVSIGYPLSRAKYFAAICEGLGVQEFKPRDIDAAFERTTP
jgi:hypothetical protein